MLSLSTKVSLNHGWRVSATRIKYVNERQIPSCRGRSQLSRKLMCDKLEGPSKLVPETIGESARAREPWRSDILRQHISKQGIRRS